MFRSIVYKILRGVLATAAGAGMTALAATPIGWLAIPIVGAIGKALRVAFVKAGHESWEKWVII